MCIHTSGLPINKRACLPVWLVAQLCTSALWTVTSGGCRLHSGTDCTMSAPVHGNYYNLGYKYLSHKKISLQCYVVNNKSKSKPNK